MVACCIGATLSKVRAAVPRQRHHGGTARECEDEEECCDSPSFDRRGSHSGNGDRGFVFTFRCSTTQLAAIPQRTSAFFTAHACEKIACL